MMAAIASAIRDQEVAMQIEEVMAIAKTLRPVFMRIEKHETWPKTGNKENCLYWISWRGYTFGGKNWRDVLINAGWKG